MIIASITLLAYAGSGECSISHITFSTLRKKCSNSEFFWSVFSRIRTKYGEILCIYPCSARVRENTYQKKSENGHFSRSAIFERKPITFDCLSYDIDHVVTKRLLLSNFLLFNVTIRGC